MRTHAIIAIPLLVLAGCTATERNRPGEVQTVTFDAGTIAPTATRVGRPVPRDFNTEEYDRIEENDFLEVRGNPLSTFAIDVDAASYGNVRRFLGGGSLPPIDAVRIEELVNYFDYDYPDPEDGHPFSVTTETSTAPWNPAHRLVHVGIQGRRMDARDLPPANLVFLVDVSGSMDEPDKLPLVQQSLRLLVSRLREEDRVAIVVYAGSAGLVLPSTSGADRRAIREAIDCLRAGGSTAGGAGLRLAYRVARENFRRRGNNRVILATDGDFNVGVSSDAELVRLIEEEREHGVFLTVLGFGTGNLKDSKMEQLADHGNGNYAYIDGIAEARKVLVGEMGGTLLTLAKDVKVQVEFNPEKVKAYRLIGYENRLLAAEDFNDDRRDGGELGAGHSVTALYEIVPADSDEPVRGTDPLRYQETRPRGGERHPGELLMVKLRYKPPTGDVSRLIEHPVLDRSLGIAAASEDFRFSAAVAAWGMLLRRSPHRGSASWDGVVRLARGSLGDDRHGYREEFVRLVEESRLIARRDRRDDDDEDVGGN
ncbi:MAG TPA: VWA domain-containing protein [Longimicrobiaceae bacterium]|nr:VWA domain-containing protein [Longimicrobiaceae bacterium]